MLYVIPGSHNCGIRDDLSVWRDGRCIHRSKNKLVTIELFGESVTRSPAWLLCISKVAKIDKFDVKHLHFKYIKRSKSRFPWFAWYDTPKVFNKTYRVVPSYPDFAVNESGHVLHVSTGAPVDIAYTHNDGHGYVQCKTSYTGRYYMVGVHRLVALAWIKNDDPETKLVVNHLHGGERHLDNSASNLEWTTYRGNSLHARNTGLLPFACSCRIRSIRTGEEKLFASVAEMSRFLGIAVTKEENYYNNRRGNKLFNDEWEIRLSGDNRPWIYAQKCANVEPSRYIFKITEPGKEPILYNGIRSVIRDYKLWNLPSWSCKEMLERFHHDYPTYSIEVTDQYNLRPIEVKDLETGKVTTYASNKELHEKTGWCKTSVIDAINYGGKRVLYGRYVLRRKTDKPWPKDLRIVQNRPVKLTLIEKSTQKTITCTSLRNASIKTGIERGLIARMLEKPLRTDKFIVNKAPASSSDR